MKKDKKLTLFGLAMPIFLDMVLRSFSVIINTYMVTQVNVKLVGAMAAGNQIFNLFIAIFGFLGIGCSVVVAQSLGAKNMNLALRAIHISISFNAILGLISTALIFFYTRFFLELLNVPEDIFEYSYIYLHYMALALFVAGIGVVVAAIIRVKNLATSIVFVSLFANIIVVFSNAIALGFIGGVNYGLKGVAISSFIAQSFALICLIFIFVKKAKIHIYFGLFFKFTTDIVIKILKVGLPAAGENLLWLVQYMVAFSFIGLLGSSALSVQAIYFQISMFIFLIPASIAMGTEVIIGHLVGSSKFKLAYIRGFNSLKISLIISSVILIVFYIFKEQIMDALNLTSELKDVMRPLFTLSLFLETGRAFNITMVANLRASGDARYPFYLGIIFMWGVSLPVGYLCGIHLGYGIVGVWMGFLVDEWARAFFNTWRWVSRKWIDKKLV